MREEPSEMPTVPDSVLVYVHAYGDSRADDDGRSGLRIGELILALRRWAKSIAAPTTEAALLEALKEAQAGLEFAAARLPHTTGFVPSHIAALNIVNAALAAAPTTQAAPVAQGDAPTDAGPISREWLTVVYRNLTPGEEVRQICEHDKVSAMSWSHAIHDRDAARAQAKKGGA